MLYTIISPPTLKQRLHRFLRALPGLLAVAAFPAHAVICKTINEEGVVGYTDTPVNECTTPVKLPEYSRYAPRPLSTPIGSSATQDDRSANPPEFFAGYTDMQIETPKNNGTVRSNEGKVPVKVVLRPALQKDHKIQFLLDGKSAGSPSASMAATLTGVTRGTHSLSAQVQNKNGRVLRSAGPIKFTLRKEALEQTPGSGDDNGAYTPEYDPAGDQDKSYGSKKAAEGTFDEGEKFKKDFDTSNKADYSSTPGSIPKSKGTNPAFSPKYKP